MSAQASSTPVTPINPHLAGIGWRFPHYREVLDTRPAVGFLEVHSENFFMAGGASLATLEAAREHYPISLHGVGLALGGATELRRAHLDKLAALVARIQPSLVSEHVCWGGMPGQVLNDLLPLPYTEEALALMVSRVHAVQDRLQRPLLVENLSQYLQYAQTEMSEITFLARLSQQTGCKILLDLNNLYVNAQNFSGDWDGLQSQQFTQLRPEMIGEIHLAGHLVTPTCLIDTHGSRVIEPVWALYAAVIERFGAIPTLIEWDTDIPDLAVLLEEAARANQYLQAQVHLKANLQGPLQ
jgi:uncharacterized protein (UPF0276 family)